MGQTNKLNMFKHDLRNLLRKYNAEIEFVFDYGYWGTWLKDERFVVRFMNEDMDYLLTKGYAINGDNLEVSGRKEK